MGTLAATGAAVRRAVAVLLVLVALWSAELGLAQAGEPTGATEAEECDGCVRVDAIVVDGLLRTHRDVIERELLFEEGELVSIDEIEESVQRLRNTEIFRRVDYELVDRRIGAHAEEAGEEDPGMLLAIDVDERWTMSAFFQFGQGGDTFHIMVGAMDINLRGKNQHLEATYSRLGDANSAAALYRHPRAFGGSLELALRGQFNNRLYTLYDGEGVVEGGFMRRRRGISLRLDREIHPLVRAGVRSAFFADDFSYEMVSEERRQAQEAAGGLRGPIQTWRLGLGGRLGRLDQDEYRISGTSLDADLYKNVHFGDLDRRSREFRATLRHFVDLRRNATLGMRGRIGFVTADAEHMKYFAGGLDAIRGTYDMRHRGSHYWSGNMELRVPSIKNDWMVIQHALFVDGVGVTQYSSQVFDLTAVTTGTGVRLIFRDLHALIIRIDYALPVWGADGPGLSFGAGQFF